MARGPGDVTIRRTEDNRVHVSNGTETVVFGPADGQEFLKFLQLQRGVGFAPPSEPHFDAETHDFFQEKIGAARLYLEYGSGGSTLVADRLGVPTISVECDGYFAAAVRKALKPDTKVDLIHAYIGFTREWGRPVFHTPNPQRLALWRNYSSVPFPKLKELGAFPDFVLVDGRFRSACALRTAREATLAGAAVTILIDDYFDGKRPSYRRVEGVLGPPRQVGRSAVYDIDPAAPLDVAAIDRLLPAAERDFE